MGKVFKVRTMARIHVLVDQSTPSVIGNWVISQDAFGAWLDSYLMRRRRCVCDLLAKKKKKSVYSCT